MALQAERSVLELEVLLQAKQEETEVTVSRLPQHIPSPGSHLNQVSITKRHHLWFLIPGKEGKALLAR